MNRTTVIVLVVLAAVAYWFVRRQAGRPVDPFRALEGKQAPGGDALLPAPAPALVVNPFAPPPAALAPANVYTGGSSSPGVESQPVRSTWTPDALEAQHQKEIGDALDYYAQERAAALV